MSLKDIEKLKEKVDKDPNSKLFVPLAEEYRKEGMLDDAVKVLLTGLERQPGYVSARVSLGKIYLEKGQMPEARTEFEQVVRAIPDNLFAHRKLAELYRDTGEKSLAIKAFKTVLNLNPKDEDSLMQLRDLESLEAPPPPEEPAASATAEQESPSFPTGEFGEISFGEPAGGPSPAEEPMAEQIAEDDLADFKNSIFGANDDEAAPSDLAPAEEVVELAEEAVEEEGLSFADIEDETREVSPAGMDMSEHLISEEIKAQPLSQEMPIQEAPAVKGEGTTIDHAEQCIAAGDYSGAISIYRKMLAADPDNRKALQRVEELRGLLKLMGKDKEELIAKMNAFLEAVQKRRDEFLRRT